MEYRKKRGMLLRHIILAPFIYLPIVAFVILDVIMEFYHQIGFRLCGLPLVDRSRYIRLDRHKLGYITFFEKVYCNYCGYANGLLRYCAEIAARTERYWCGIRHRKDKSFIEPEYQKDFVPFGDEKAYHQKYDKN